MNREILWEVDADQWDAVCEATDLFDNAAISQQDYLEKLRALGMPQEARPGANLRIRRVARRLISVPGALPGLPAGRILH